MFRGFSKSDPLIKVTSPKLYQLYHVAWGRSNGVVGKVVAINSYNRTVIIRSPVTGKTWRNPVSFDDLRHTRKNQLKNPH